MPDGLASSRDGEKDPHTAPNFENAFWKNKPLTPAQLLVHDISLKSTNSEDDESILEINEKPAWTLLPEKLTAPEWPRANKSARNPIEAQRFAKLEDDFGWIRHLRWQSKTNIDAVDAGQEQMCRWIHVSSKFPEYLPAFFYTLSSGRGELSHSVRILDETIQQQTRTSKHGKYFAPFHQNLPGKDGQGVSSALISVPWLDWSITGTPPPLRFQIDKREGFRSVRSAVHPLRSILQYYYRLEDTRSREPSQCFTKHKPWLNDKELDLQIRQWYGHHPTALVVDELWILVIDAKNIVTFSSNVTWKSRWPPLQLSSRIADVSFRHIRNHFSKLSTPGQRQDYTAATHAITALSGAIGMMHRNFWPDIPLCLADRYASYFGHLQYRLHRAPSTKLVMNLIDCVDELNIAIQVTQQQMDLLQSLSDSTSATGNTTRRQSSPRRRHQPLQLNVWDLNTAQHKRTSSQTFSNISTSNLTDPLAQCIENLQRELTDLEDLHFNTNALVTRTIQLVNIRLEDNNKAILVFTVVTIVFLPLNFIASFFGMNVSDIRNLDQTQALFWLVAVLMTFGVAALSTLVAFQGGAIYEKFMIWSDNRQDLRRAADRSIRNHRIYG